MSENCGTAGIETDLDSIISTELVAKTDRLSIVDSGTANEAITGVENGHCLLDKRSAETLCSPEPSIQPYVATTEGWQGDTHADTTLTGVVAMPSPASQSLRMASSPVTERAEEEANDASMVATVPQRTNKLQLLDLPNEVLFHILSYLEVCDLLATSRTSRHLRTLSLNPHLHQTRLRRTRAILPPLLTSPSRPSRADLVRRSIVLTHTAFASRRLARSLASIRLARQLAKRPSAETLVERCVLPPECLPLVPRSPASSSSGGSGGGKRRNGSYAGVAPVAPALIARKRAVERERVKDGLRAWVGSVWKGEVGKRQEKVRMWEERAGVGRVWRLRRFWEKVGRGEQV
ncbi:hypothetical protein L209DRAFT_753799 [Thermothelomyces heterothallicus CBS 203.75]